MITVDRSPRLSAKERFALDVLVDLSRLLPARASVQGAVRLVVRDSPAPITLSAALASDWTIRVGDGEVSVGRAALELAADVVSAAAEQRSSAADRFGRVPPTENELVARGLEDRPVVSQAAALLAGAARRAAGRRPLRLLEPWPDGRRWAVALTHDLDAVDWWPAFTALRLAELTRKGEAGRALRALAAAAMSVGRSPTADGVSQLLAVEQGTGARATWFILCGSPTFGTMRAGDLTYDAAGPGASRILQQIRTTGHEIGLHGSFATADDGSHFVPQRQRLASLIGGEVRGVRQHYLRMRPNSTPAHMAAAGFAYDSTFGFADRNGFRLGVADVVPAWSASREERVGLDLAPFAWMDRALSKYRGIENPSAWIADGLRLARECQRANGLWVGVWHPNLVPAMGYPGAPEAYRTLVSELSRAEPYFGTLDELVAWRSARRSVEAVAVEPSGAVRAEATEGPGTKLWLEDGDGRRLEEVDPVAAAGR